MPKPEFDYYYGAEAEQFSFVKVPKVLFSDKEHFGCLSNDARILYGFLLERMSLSRKNNWIDAHNRVYIIFPIDEIAEIMGVCHEKALNILKELDEQNGIGLVIGKIHFRIKACLQILSAETGEVFHDNSADFTVLDRFNKSFEIGTVKVCACVAVINEKFGVVITVVVGIFQKKLLLVLYAHAVTVKKIVLAEPAIEGCDFFLLF